MKGYAQYYKTLLTVFLMLMCAVPSIKAEQTDEYQEGFLTAYLNNAIEKAMSNDDRQLFANQVKPIYKFTKICK